MESPARIPFLSFLWQLSVVAGYLNLNSHSVMCADGYFSRRELPLPLRIPVLVWWCHLPNEQSVAAWLGRPFKRSKGIYLDPHAAEVVDHTHVSSEMDISIRQVIRQCARQSSSNGAPNRTRDTHFDMIQSLPHLEIKKNGIHHILNVWINEIEDSFLHRPRSCLRSDKMLSQNSGESEAVAARPQGRRSKVSVLIYSVVS